MHRFLLVLGVFLSLPARGQSVFLVPGQERAIENLEALFHQHRVAGPNTTLWDPWLPMSVLWWDTTNSPTLQSLRDFYRSNLLNRRIDAEGYVSSQQHEGLAHSEGWPFPLYTQAGGVGWLFTTQGVPYGPEFGIRPTTTVTNWQLASVSTQSLATERGWTIRFDGGSASLVTPSFSVDTLVAPFLRVQWSGRGLGPHAVAFVEWQRAGQSDFPPDQRLYFDLPESDGVIANLNLPMSRHPAWNGRVTRLGFRLQNLSAGAELTLRRLFTAIDSRHNINNAVYLQACDDYARWTGDLGFLRRNLPRMRLALAWAIREFRMADEELVVTPWVGHDGRSGHAVDASGGRTLRPGVGVGNNYWDLLPFGGRDALATIYYYDAIRRMAALEQQVERHPDWNLPEGPLRFLPSELRQLSEAIRETGNDRFWNDGTGRFDGWLDADGQAHDFGFTFVNNEAIYYGFASEAHAQAIREWLDGRRTIDGDTSTGPDIYHWRFGPRATTRRNLDTYFWGWSEPASIPWGGQVQDGGAVLGFSYHDLMARLGVNGPDDAWGRLQEVLDWYGEVRSAGGYREYYKAAGRGTLQGGGTAGGLGLDHEFFESALVPQVMLYGFLGFHPRLDGCLIAPRLPREWPSLTIRGIRLHDLVLNVTAERERWRVEVQGTPARPLSLYTPGPGGSRFQLREGVLEIAAQP